MYTRRLEAIIDSRGRGITASASNVARMGWKSSGIPGCRDRGPRDRFGAQRRDRLQLWLTTKARFSPTERQRLFGLTIAIGGVCGLVAVAFHQSIRWLEKLTIERAFGAPGDAWILWVILVPSLGALASGVMLYYVPGARGSGVPQVKVAYASKALTLRLRDSIGKFVIGALQIGTGSSLGREGPTVQICAGVAKAGTSGHATPRSASCNPDIDATIGARRGSSHFSRRGRSTRLPTAARTGRCP